MTKQLTSTSREDGMSSDECVAETGTVDHSEFERIQERAYQLWEQAGQPAGEALREQFWFDAEKLVKADAVQKQPVSAAV